MRFAEGSTYIAPDSAQRQEFVPRVVESKNIVRVGGTSTHNTGLFHRCTRVMLSWSSVLVAVVLLLFSRYATAAQGPRV